MKNEEITFHKRPFNTPLEIGLRDLFILGAIAPKQYDLQRIIYYDYLLIHSGDVNNGPESLHPPIPYRSGEWIVHRELVSDGLDLMFAKELLNKHFDKRGILYSASELTRPFLKHLNCDYAIAIRERAIWVSNAFENYSNSKLSDFMIANVGRWGTEFKREAILWSIPYEQ
jgi:hypothetical protein